MAAGFTETAGTCGGEIDLHKELVFRSSPTKAEAVQIKQGNFIGKLSLIEATEGNVTELALATSDYDYIFPETGGPRHLLVPVSSVVEPLRAMAPEDRPESARYAQAAEAFVGSPELFVIPLSRAIRR